MAALRPLVALLTLTLLLPGCVAFRVGGGSSGSGGRQPVDIEGVQEVRLDVRSGPTGTLALIPVSFGDRGPYPFALDTGASRTVVDAGLAEELGLQQLEAREPVRGVTGRTTAGQVRVARWAIGSVVLPASTLATIDLAGGEAPLRGLLGSDVLSRFGSVEIDYDRKVLLLKPKEGSSQETDF